MHHPLFAAKEQAKQYLLTHHTYKNKCFSKFATLILIWLHVSIGVDADYMSDKLSLRLTSFLILSTTCISQIPLSLQEVTLREWQTVHMIPFTWD